MTWTTERRQKQAAMIRTWKPWEQSTGPKTPEGKAASSRNTWKGGHRQKLRAIIQLVRMEVRQAQDMVASIQC
jgi:hypothetical protein